VWLRRTSGCGEAGACCWRNFLGLSIRRRTGWTGRFEKCGDSRARCLEHANNLRRAWHRLIVVRTLDLAGLSRMGVATCLDSRSVHRCAVRQAKATVRPAPG
jgi:hypothetical protein